MQTLTLNKAIELYWLIKPFLPEEVSDLAPIDFIQQLVDNIIQANKPKIYLDMVSLMTEISIERLLQNEPQDVLDACIERLNSNNVLELIDFCRKIGL